MEEDSNKIDNIGNEEIYPKEIIFEEINGEEISNKMEREVDSVSNIHHLSESTESNLIENKQSLTEIHNCEYTNLDPQSEKEISINISEELELERNVASGTRSLGAFKGIEGDEEYKNIYIIDAESIRTSNLNSSLGRISNCSPEKQIFDPVILTQNSVGQREVSQISNTGALDLGPINRVSLLESKGSEQGDSNDLSLYLRRQKLIKDHKKEKYKEAKKKMWCGLYEFFMCFPSKKKKKSMDKENEEAFDRFRDDE